LPSFIIFGFSQLDDEYETCCKPTIILHLIVQVIHPIGFHCTDIRPFETVPPPSQRKLKIDKHKRRLKDDIETLIVRRNIGDADVEDLRRAVHILCATEEEEPMEFDWEVDMYRDAWSLLQDDEGSDDEYGENDELTSAANYHPVGSIWAVRSDFATKSNWQNKKNLELFWICVVTGKPILTMYEGSEQIVTPVRYYEGKIFIMTSNGKKRKQYKYKMGPSSNDLPVADLQTSLALNNADKAGYASIKHKYIDKINHKTKRWVMEAKGQEVDFDGSDSD
jgi:hypothetical protein